jgi:hypothetical protein
MTIREFLAGIGLEQYTDVFEENGIEVDILPELEEADLPDLGIKLLGHRKKLMKAIRLQGPSSKEMAASGAPAPKAAPAEAPAPKAPAPIPAAQPKPDFNDTTVQPVTVVPRTEAPAPAPEKVKRRVSRQDLVSTIVEQATSPAKNVAARSAGETIPADNRGSSQRIKRLKRSSIERIPAATDPNASPAPVEPKPTKEVAPVAARRKKKQSGFSETQWFMAGAKEDADILEAQSDQVDYDHDSTISEEDRKGFTLRDDE